MMTASLKHSADQAKRPIFRRLMVVQLLSAGFIGLVHILVPGVFASISGQSGREELIYRLAAGLPFDRLLFSGRWAP